MKHRSKCFRELFCLIQVADAKTQAQEAKDKAQAALMKASDTKDKMEQSNNDLRDLIKQIRAFLMREFVPLYNYIYDTHCHK